MPTARAVTLILAVLAGTSAAGIVGAGAGARVPVGSTISGAPIGTSSQQTHPAVAPRRGTRRTRFSVRFTLADAPGHQGVMATSYRVQVDPPASSRAACAAPAPPPIDSGTLGARTTVALARPPHGWCTGRYAVRVFLQRGPYCPKPQDGQPPQPCPLFALRDIAVGATHFAVTATARKG